MTKTFSKEDILQNKFSDIFSVTEIIRKESHPDPDYLELIEANYYKVQIFYEKLGINDCLDIEDVLLGKKSQKYISVPKPETPIKGKLDVGFTGFSIRKSEMDDITIEWTDIQEK